VLALSARKTSKRPGGRRTIRGLRIVPSALLVSGLLALSAGAALADPTLELTQEGHTERLATVEVDGNRLVPLTPLCRALGVVCELRLETATVAISGPGGRALFGPGSARVLLGDLVVPLSSAPCIVRGEIYVPPDFLTRIVAQVLNRRIELYGLRANVLASPPSRLQEQSGPLLPKPVLTVVLDPGHGGKDTGATGKTGLMEKEVALEISLSLKRILEQDPSYRVVLTRSEDTFLDLASRTAIGNERGDCFVSIHLNAGGQEGVAGFEVYSMSPRASDKAALAASRFENQLEAVAGVPPELEPVLWDMAQNDYVNESATFAEMMISTLSQRFEKGNRGAKQAPFLVLAGATVPAILVEVAFISNGEQEAALRDDGYRQKLAEALATGVESYLERYRSKYGSALLGP
jgi:N-acetylmuramoyl-L-alanine amidase